MISYLVVPLLWICPALRIPVLGPRAQASLEAAPAARQLLCQASAGLPERYDTFQAAQDRIARLGPGASLSYCLPQSDCRPVSISWRIIPSFGGIP